MPRVSVIIPAFNAAKTICTAVESVLFQSYQDHEIVVVDDGSTDETRAVLEPYFGRIQYLYQPNMERSAARNRGIRVSNGTYIAFLDADDYWLPNKLAKQVALLDRRPELGFVFSWAGAFNQEGRVVRLIGTNFPSEGAEGMDAFETLLLRTTPPMPTVVARRRCIEEVGLFDETIAQIEDWDLWVRMTLRYPIGFIPEVLACYSLSGSFTPAKLARKDVQKTRPLLVRRVFDLVRTMPERADTLRFEGAALRRAHVQAALVDYALGNIQQAILHMEMAYRHDSGFFSSSQAVANAITDFALNLYDTFTPPETAQAFLRVFFSSLPEPFAHLIHLKRTVHRSVAAGHGFRAWAQGDLAAAKLLLSRAVFTYPELATNIGIWSILARCILGKKARNKLDGCQCHRSCL